MCQAPSRCFAIVYITLSWWKQWRETWLLPFISLQQSKATVLIFGFLLYKEGGQYFLFYVSFKLLLKLIISL